MGSRQLFESLGKAMLHPFLSHGFDDRLSVLLIRSATSTVWNIVALGAPLAFIALFLLSESPRNPANSVSEGILVSYAVIGIVWNALAANVHSANSGSYGRGLLLFAVWPLSFFYNWRETLRHRRRSFPSSAA